MIKKVYLFSLILILSPFCSFATVSLEVSPIRVEHTIEKGSSETNAILVRNGGDEPARIKVRLLEFCLKEDGTPIFLPRGNSRFSLSPLIRINPVDFRLNPGQKRYVRYTLSIPDDLREGGYFSAISFETVPIVLPGKKVRKLFLKGRVVCILYERVGNPIPSGEILDLRKEGKEVFLTLKNIGSVHFRVKGKIIIEDEKGKVVERISLPDCPILPEAKRKIKVCLKETLPRGEYIIKAEVDIGRKELLLAEGRIFVER